jgi:uncharacterized RDD family membrane protein YckC
MKIADERCEGGPSNDAGIAMPIVLPPNPPPKSRARAVRARKREAIATIDWLGLWALSLGFCAVVLAGIADIMGEDNLGAAFILIGAAAVIGLVLYVSGAADEQT